MLGIVNHSLAYSLQAWLDWRYPEMYMQRVKDNLSKDGGNWHWKSVPHDLKHNLELVCWILTNKKSTYFVTGVVFQNAPEMAKEKKVWESLLTVGSREANIRMERMLKIFRVYAPLSLFADRDYMKRLCKKFVFGPVLLDQSLKTDFLYLMELHQQNTNLDRYQPFQRLYEHATFLEAWRQTQQWCDEHVRGNFDPNLWQLIREFVALPKGIDSSRFVLANPGTRATSGLPASG